MSDLRFPDKQAEKYGPDGKRRVPPSDMMSSFVTRQEAMTHVATAVAEATRKAMEEMDSALEERLVAMEEIIAARVYRQLEARTLRYRVKMWVRGVLTEIGLLSPVQLQPPATPAEDVAPVEVRTWRECPQGMTHEIMRWLEEEDGRVAMVRKPGTATWHLCAKNTPLLAAAARMLGGENPSFADGTITAELDREFLERGRWIIRNGGSAEGAPWLQPDATSSNDVQQDAT